MLKRDEAYPGETMDMIGVGGGLALLAVAWVWFFVLPWNSYLNETRDCAQRAESGLTPESWEACSDLEGDEWKASKTPSRSSQE
jgi:hypothetical protein